MPDEATSGDGPDVADEDEEAEVHPKREFNRSTRPQNHRRQKSELRRREREDEKFSELYGDSSDRGQKW